MSYCKGNQERSMAYEIIHDYEAHWDILGEYDTLEEATSAFHQMVKDWGAVDPQSCYLELRYYDEEEGDVTQEDILIHELTDPSTWEY